MAHVSRQGGNLPVLRGLFQADGGFMPLRRGDLLAAHEGSLRELRGSEGGGAMIVETKCVATHKTPGRHGQQRPAGYVRKVHNFKAGDFCVYCGAARR